MISFIHYVTVVSVAVIGSAADTATLQNASQNAEICCQHARARIGINIQMIY